MYQDCFLRKTPKKAVGVKNKNYFVISENNFFPLNAIKITWFNLCFKRLY